MKHVISFLTVGVLAIALTGATARAQAPAAPQPGASSGAAAAAGTARTVATGVPLPPGYVIGAEDVLNVVFWREKDLSADVVVRPDGKISLPLLNDVQAAGFTPEQLSEVVEKAAAKYVAEPDATVIVREVRSSKVFVLGEVARPGTIPLTREMNVLQLIAEVGGLLEHAHKDDVVIIRKEARQERRFRFNYNEVVKGTRTEQNILLRPGDVIVVR